MPVYARACMCLGRVMKNISKLVAWRIQIFGVQATALKGIQLVDSHTHIKDHMSATQFEGLGLASLGTQRRAGISEGVWALQDDGEFS